MICSNDKIFYFYYFKVGYSTGTRTVTLQDSGCFRSGIIQHEFIHVLGQF